jgi:lysophospholipase
MADLENKVDFLALNDEVRLRYRVSIPEGGALRGSVLLLQGRAENIEKYAEQIDRLNRMGFSVFTFDWRGQGLSGRLLADSHKGYIGTFDHYLEDLQHFDEKVWKKQAGKGPRYLIAHSLGGHVALRYLVEKQVTLDGVLLVSPMFDINTGRWPRQVAELFARTAVMAGFEERYIPGAGPYVGRVFSEQNLLTSDSRHFYILPEIIKNNPELALGGPTFGWLDAAFSSMRQIQAKGYAEAVKSPVMVLLGEEDRVISPSSVAQLCKRMANCEQALVKHAKHEIMMEAEPIQQYFWTQVDAVFRRQ